LKLCSTCKCELTTENVNKGDTKCRSCRSAYRKKYYEQDKTSETQRYSEWRKENADRINEYKRVWRKTRSPEQLEEIRRKQREANFKLRWGENWKEAKEVYELTKVVRDDPAILAASPARRRAKQKRDSGYNRTDWARRKARASEH